MIARRLAFAAGAFALAMTLPAQAAQSPSKRSTSATDTTARRQTDGSGQNVADPDTPAPGQLGRDATEIPSPYFRDKTVKPKKPDLEMKVDDRTSVGVFQEMNRPDPSVLAPGRQPRELGAGFTLQHRFGGP